MDSYHWLEDLHRAHYATLLRLARHRLQALTNCTAEAEDVVQDAFLLAAEKDIRHLEQPLAWLMKTTSNLCLQRMDRARGDDGRAKRLAARKLLASGDRSAGAVEREESPTDALLWLMLLEETLSPQEWEIMRRYCLLGQPLSDVAADMQVPVNRLKVRIHRIRKKLEKISQQV